MRKTLASLTLSVVSGAIPGLLDEVFGRYLAEARLAPADPDRDVLFEDYLRLGDRLAAASAEVAASTMARAAVREVSYACRPSSPRVS